jgi:Ca2+-binding RTX toxin-like protein
VITDFTAGEDQIDLSGLGSGLSFIAGNGYSNTAGEVRYNGAIGRLYVDLDGDSASDFSVDLTGIPALTEADLIL